jgi:hypothetical protein
MSLVEEISAPSAQSDAKFDTTTNCWLSFFLFDFLLLMGTTVFYIPVSSWASPHVGLSCPCKFFHLC